MFGFVAGLVAGAVGLKLYQVTSTEDDNDEAGDALAPMDPRNRFQTSSRETHLNKSSTNFYSEEADTSGVSHVNFLSDMVARLWPYIARAGEDMIKEMIEPTLQESLPGPLATLRFKKLDLGHVPLVLDNILVRELRRVDDPGMAYGENPSYIQFEWDVTWYSKCDIQLATDKIGGMAAIKFGVKGVGLSGRLQVIAKPLGTTLPCMDAVQFAFVNPPKIKLDFTGLANLADMNIKIGGMSVVDIKGTVRGIVGDTLAQSLVLPNRTVAPLVDKVDYRNIFCPAYKGLVRVRLHSGRGFEIQKATSILGSDDIPDVYVKMRLGAEEFFQSSVVEDDCNPVWDPEVEFVDFLFCSGRDQILEIQVWDRDTGTLDPDDRLGDAFVTIGQALLEADRNGMYELQLFELATSEGKNDKPTKQHLTISVEKLPFTPRDLSSVLNPERRGGGVPPDGLSAKKRKKQETKDRARVVVGLATILISHATDLPFREAEEANTFVKLTTGTGSGAHEIGTTVAVPDSLNPQYQAPFSFPLKAGFMKQWNANRDQQCFAMELFQQDPTETKPRLLGRLVIDHSEVTAGEYWSLRDERQIGNNPKTKLAFAITFAGVRPSLMKNRFSKASSTNSISIGSIESGEIQTFADGTASQLDASSNASGIELVDKTSRIRVQIIKAWGFEAEKRKRFKKADIPDVYCMTKFGSSPHTWRTPTIKDSITPTWENEYHDYVMESANEVISIDVWDENRRSDDDFYGNARTSVGKVLLNNGHLDIEVKSDGSGKKPKSKKTMAGTSKPKMYITIQCSKL
mmetsp:Transcript_27570/g.60821  ORF Transcript_27570/g.60821 Transcript_27570/m.60821 type:complete len:799 (-) Transcript_27570:638-3034(-)